MASYQYIVKSDERWDNIANAAYGTFGEVTLSDGTKKYTIDLLVEANPDVFIVPIVPAGTILNIPILSKTDSETNTELLPPWMQ